MLHTSRPGPRSSRPPWPYISLAIDGRATTEPAGKSVHVPAFCIQSANIPLAQANHVVEQGWGAYLACSGWSHEKSRGKELGDWDPDCIPFDSHLPCRRVHTFCAIRHVPYQTPTKVPRHPSQRFLASPNFGQAVEPSRDPPVHSPIQSSFSKS